MKILFAIKAFPSAVQRLQKLLPDDLIAVCSPEEVPAKIADAEVVIPSVSSVDAEVIEKAGRLKLIQQYGVGLESVDIQAAKRRGIPVANVPSPGTGNAESVAEHAILLMLALARQLDVARLGRGIWGGPEGLSLYGKNVVVVGLGGVGQALVRRLYPFGMTISGVELPQTQLPADLPIYRRVPPDELDNVLPGAHFVVICAILTPETRHMFNRQRFLRMHPGSFLINVSRGGLVNAEDLLDALSAGRLAGAGLDVFWQEPVDPSHPIFSHNVIGTRHVAGVTDYSFERLCNAVVTNINRVRNGLLPLNCVNCRELELVNVQKS